MALPSKDGGTPPTTYRPVLFKSTEGTVTLTADHLAFQPGARGNEPAKPHSVLPYRIISKHQVSPSNYPKALLKVVLAENGKALTFQLPNRDELERIRKDITRRLRRYRANNGAYGTPNNSIPAVPATNTSNSPQPIRRSYSGGISHHIMLSRQTTNAATSIEDLDPTALAVTRSSLLAANQSLRAQHQFLVEETKTVEEDDFWKTHDNLLQEEYAKICGLVRAGTSSLLQSHLPLQGRVTLGVEEMRQIFILYPAVHKAYEEKVPLELSDEQFWRKYLESEFFHRDRGRLGTTARNHAADASKEKDKVQRTADEQEARAAAVGTDDLFSRYDQKLREEADRATKANASAMAGSTARVKKWGTHLAVGQFDLASTFETERGNVLEGPRDNHPPNSSDDGGRGAKVIQKYNRHWAMVLHPEQAVAGSNLMDVARRSVKDVLENDDDAKAMGGLDVEMKRLVNFATADKDHANHALGTGIAPDEGDAQEQLTLKNVEAYYTSSKTGDSSKPLDSDDFKRQAFFSQTMASKMQALAAQTTQSNGGSIDLESLSKLCFPEPQTGRELLKALTRKMEQDSQTNAQTLEVVKTLPEDFKKRLHSYFRRSSELLRHFFGLRRLEAKGGSETYSKKLARIVEGMETFYREMEGMRRELPQTETGELMRKMCLPIMDQLDNAFKLHREGTGGARRGGGFVTVEEL